MNILQGYIDKSAINMCPIDGLVLSNQKHIIFIVYLTFNSFPTMTVQNAWFPFPTLK